MLRRNNRSTFLLVICLLVLSSNAWAEAARRDFLVGIGDFELSSYMRWYSAYKGADYDFAANSLYVSPKSGDYTNGYNLPSSLDSAANGWIRTSNEVLRPDKNIECRIVDGEGIGGSNCQYFAIKDVDSGNAKLRLDTHIAVDSSKSYCIHPGDSVTFRIDMIKMSGYSDLPSGSGVQYLMWIDSSGSLALKDLVLSEAPYVSEITARVPAGVSDINCIIEIRTTGNLGGSRPGIYVDGAHVYVKRQGQTDYEYVDFPLGDTRNVKTHLLFGSLDDLYAVAGNYDVFPLTEGDYLSIEPLNVLNPNAKLDISYSGAGVLNRVDDSGNDRWANQSVFNFSEIVKNHPDWLYTGGNGIGGYVNYYTYPERYALHLTNKDYQTELADRLIDRARRFGVSGVWLDDLVDRSGILYADGKIKQQQIEPWEVQQLVHAIAPKLHEAGLTITHNLCDRHLDGGRGDVYFNPWWEPNSSYPESEGYSANTPDNTADVFFQEWAFITYSSDKNIYDSAHWLQCLNDMNAIEQLNTTTGDKSLPEKRKKYMHMFVLGVDSPTDPAYGIDGWLHFGLCSYLLAQNDWTYLGFKIKKYDWVNPAPEVDLAITKKLGAPDGRHWANVGDAYCRWRRYKPTDDGGVGGVVVANANPTTTRTYRLDIDATDESGNIIPSGTKIKLAPHTGRIFLQRQLLDVNLSVQDDNVYSGQTVDINVEYHNKSSSAVTNVSVQVQVPEQMTYVTGSAEKSGGRYYPETNTVVWTVSSVIPNGTGTKTFRATVN